MASVNSAEVETGPIAGCYVYLRLIQTPPASNINANNQPGGAAAIRETGERR